MPTDIRKINLDDLLGRLYYANVNHEWDEGDAIKAEIARRIEVRDRAVKWLLDESECRGGFEAMDGLVVLQTVSSTIIYKDNGEQIL